MLRSAFLLILLLAPSASAETYELATQWPVSGIDCIATDAAGNVYLAGGTQVQKFDGNGGSLATWTVPDGYLRGISIDGTGNVYLAARTSSGIGGNDGRIVRLDPSGVETFSFDVKNCDGKPVGASCVAVNEAGTLIYVGISFDDCSYGIVKYDAAGNALFGWSGSQDMNYREMDVAMNGDLYDIHDFDEPQYHTDHAYRWTADGAPLDLGFSTPDSCETSSDGYQSGERSLALDHSGNVWVTTCAGLRKYSSTGKELAVIDRFLGPIAVDRNGNVLAIEGSPREGQNVLKFSPTTNTPVARASWGQLKARWSR